MAPSLGCAKSLLAIGFIDPGTKSAIYHRAAARCSAACSLIISAFEKEGVYFAFGLDPIRIVDLRYQRHSLIISSARILKILPHSEHCRLADINHLPCLPTYESIPPGCEVGFELFDVEGGSYFLL